MSKLDQKPALKVVERPWGYFKQYASNEEVTVSLMTVKEGQRLSLQCHSKRAELWIVLDEGAEIQIGDKIIHPESGDELWIPVGEKHRLGSLAGEVRVLEVAFGDWQQEDIKRFDDDYARPNEGE